jgi:hypothetical protein
MAMDRGRPIASQQGGKEVIKVPRIPRTLAITACAAALGVGALIAATTQTQASASHPSSAARYAAAATSYQNTTITEAAALMPGGTRVSRSEVAWKHGAVILRVRPTPAAPDRISCPSGYFCAQGSTAGRTDVWEFENAQARYGADYWLTWGGFYPSGVQDWNNQTGYRVWLESVQNGGNELCISNGGTGTNNTNYWILMTNNSSHC